MKVEEGNLAGFESYIVNVKDIVIGIPIEIGPRILHLASSKTPDFNLFGILSGAGSQTAEGYWRIYGGHRLWTSPESKPRSYSLDNKPVNVEISDRSVSIIGNPEVENSVQKTITIEPSDRGGIKVTHAIRNIGRWPIRLACWGLSVMRQNGFAMVPMKSSKADEEGLLPDRHLTLWPYTDASDERLKIVKEFIFVEQNPQRKDPLKIGTMANPPWIAYWVGGTAFVKLFASRDGEYPDFGCDVEVYTNAEMLELETLSPLQMLNPSEQMVQNEVWGILEVGKLKPTLDDVKRFEEILEESGLVYS